MRLPNPLAAYRRWRFRRRMAMAGFDHHLADDVYAVYIANGASAAEELAFERLAAQCYQDMKALDGALN